LKQYRIIKVGRDAGNDVVMDHVTISRRHAELFIDEDQNVFLTDLNSMYGTYVNGEKIMNPIILNRHDVVCFGDEQYLDWEWVVFGEKKREFKDTSEGPFSATDKDNRELIIIYGAILLVLAILFSKI
jgi:pSer/pThr/pTyr-binding forkhead associated (FHA) protein